MMTKRAVPKAVHSIAQLARAVHGLESNPWRRILQQKCGHGRAFYVVDGRRHDRVLRRRLLAYGRNLVAIWTVLAGFAGRRVILALLSLRLWRRCLQPGALNEIRNVGQRATESAPGLARAESEPAVHSKGQYPRQALPRRQQPAAPLPLAFRKFQHCAALSCRLGSVCSRHVLGT